MDDQLDNRDALRLPKPQVTPAMLKRGSLKGKVAVRLGDHNNTIIYCKPGMEDEVRERYRKHLNLDV